MFEPFSTRVYLVNEISLVLCFQTSTPLTLVSAENWVLGNGLISTFFFLLGRSCCRVPSPLPKVLLSKIMLDLWAKVFTLLPENRSNACRAFKLLNQVPECTVQALCQVSYFPHYLLLQRERLGAISHGHHSIIVKRENM